MPDITDLIKEVVDGGYDRLLVSNEPPTAPWTTGRVSVCLRPSRGHDTRILLKAKSQGDAIDIAFTPDQTVAIAVAIMRKVNELREGEAS